MILGHSIFGYDLDGLVWDTPIPTEMIDVMRIFEGEYDKVYIDLDTDIDNSNDRFDGWNVKTIINADFKGNLDAGTIGAEGFMITHVQIMRSVYGSGEWETVSVHEYNSDFNTYTFVDRYVPNGVTYEYAIAPIANEIIGERLVAEPVLVDYEGLLITDSDYNFKLEYDTKIGSVTHNTSQGVLTPLNSTYPIVTNASTSYRTGQIATLPVSSNSIKEDRIDNLSEKVNREKIVNFLKDGRAKVIRIDNGTLMLVSISNVVENYKEGFLEGLAEITFSYTEIAKVDFKNLLNNGLVSGSHLSKVTFDEFGGVLIGN